MVRPEKVFGTDYSITTGLRPIAHCVIEVHFEFLNTYTTSPMCSVTEPGNPLVSLQGSQLASHPHRY